MIHRTCSRLACLWLLCCGNPAPAAAPLEPGSPNTPCAASNAPAAARQAASITATHSATTATNANDAEVDPSTANAVGGDNAGPKYPAGVVPLSRDQYYLQYANARDFWALMPYFTAQRDDVSCSLATATMLVNAGQRRLPKRFDEHLVTQTALEQKVNSPVWARGLAPNGDGVTLDEFATLVDQSFQASGLAQRVTQVVHLPDASPDALTELRAMLRLNEESGDDWVVINFWAAVVFGAGDYGHFAPVAAYNAEEHRVLVLDPDREWFEPYWVSDEVLLRAMATVDAVSGKPRGYFYVSPAPAQ